MSWAWGQAPVPRTAAAPASSPAAPANLISGPRPSTQTTTPQDWLRLARNMSPPPRQAQASTPQEENAQAQQPAPPPAPSAEAPVPGVQLEQPGNPGQTGPPVTITLQDAVARASRNYAQYLSALTDAKIANEDRVQARAAMLPSLSYTQQYLGTQGNGKLASGRFVTNDGVHVYRVWGVVHQEFPAGFFSFSPYKRAAAAAAIAQAKAEIARRGLTVTVTSLYYGLIVAQRQYATAQQVLDQ